MSFSQTMKGVRNMVPTWGSAYPAVVKGQGQAELCEECRTRPKFVENGGFQHPFCGRKCAASAAKAGKGVSATLFASRKTASPSPVTPQTDTWVQVPVSCGLRSCQNTARPQFDGYCSDVHAKYAVRKGYVAACSQCRTMPQASGVLCITCQRGNTQATSLREVFRNDFTFGNIVSAVVDSWRPTDGSNNSNHPTIHKILKVSLPQKSVARFENYRKTLEKDGHVTEMTTFHSSQCICDLGTKAQHTLCDFPSCGICSIVKSSFSKFAFGEPFNKGRYGTGVYSYTNSARADAHATSCTTSPYRIILMCSTLVRKKKSGSPQASTSAKSVIDGDTVVVADSDAIIPTHVILYSL